MKTGTKLMSLAAVAAAGFASQAMAQSEVFAIDLRGAGALIKFPLSTPAYTMIGNVGSTTFYGLDFNADGSVLYGVNSIAVGALNLGTIDQSTGFFTQTAVISGSAAAEATLRDICFDPSTNSWYALGSNIIYTLDINTGVTSNPVPLSGGPATALYIDLAVNGSGQMYTHDIATDAMFSVNKATGAVTQLGLTGQLANFAQGMDFDPATNVLYATLYTGAGVGKFVSINTSTGLATIIADTRPWTGVGPEMEMAIKGVAAPVCYPDCNGDGQLNLSDFGCFTTKFALGEAYADCNGDGIRNLADFGCFTTKFALGCP